MTTTDRDDNSTKQIKLNVPSFSTMSFQEVLLQWNLFFVEKSMEVLLLFLLLLFVCVVCLGNFLATCVSIWIK